MTRRMLLLLMFAVIQICGCNRANHLKFSQDSFHHIVPKVKPGDEITWMMDVKWIPPDQSPCEPGTRTARFCKIASNLPGNHYTYTCPNSTPRCDPDVELDEGTLPQGPPQAAPQGGAPLTGAATLGVSDVDIVLACDSSKKTTEYDANGDEAKLITQATGGNVIWAATGNSSRNNWAITFVPADDQYKVCTQRTQINQSNSMCTIPSAAASGTTASFYVTIDTCTQSATYQLQVK